MRTCPLLALREPQGPEFDRRAQGLGPGKKKRRNGLEPVERPVRICLHGSIFFDSSPVLSISAAQEILINGVRIISRARLAGPRRSILRRNSSIRRDLTPTPRPAYVRLKSSIGLEPRKRLLSKVIWPHYETYPNQNRSNVLRQGRLRGERSMSRP